MARRPLVWKLFPIYFIITLASVFVIGVYASSAIKELYYSEIERDLEIRTRMLEDSIQTSYPNSDSIQKLVNTLPQLCGARVTIIEPSGKVVADSEANPSKMENHAGRPEVKAAIGGEIGRARRKSQTLGYTMVYLALPVEKDGKVTSIIRTAIPAKALDSVPKEIYHRIVLGALLIAVMAGITSLVAARRISEPLLRMKHVADKFADGDFRSRAPISDTEEFASLAETLNRMATQLDNQVRTITRRSSEQRAILSSMKEGVVAIDNDDKILILNPMAEELLQSRLKDSKGKTIQEAIRNPDLQRFFSRAQSSTSPITEEIVFHTPEERLMQVVGTPLIDDGKQLGVLVVLNDVTQTRKLETMRKDFVANVSHELKTPITSIKGFVETLREGAMRDSERAREFLDIVAKQADRLHAIIEDLLALSTIEQKADAAEIPVSSELVRSVLDSAVMNCRSKAMESQVDVSIECEENLKALINAPLLEQAVTNLVDNAVKYTPGGNIYVRAKQVDNEVIISVEDTGVGIDAEHIPRLFERFYRIDKARSRKLGGTGLGLAIVKHIVQAHHGRIEVHSIPGKGSVFTIYLPVA